MIKILDRTEQSPAARMLRQKSYDLLRLNQGETVADIGCGAGTAVQELASRGLLAIGVDPDPQMIAIAQERGPGLDIRRGDAESLPLADGALAGYRADKVFHNIDDPHRALAEARRVLRPGARIVLLGQDWDTVVIDSDQPTLTRQIVHARADLVVNPRAARRYRRSLLDAGFTDVTVEVDSTVFTDSDALPMLAGMAEAAASSGAISSAQAETWAAEQRARAAGDRLFAVVPLFIAAATSD